MNCPVQQALSERAFRPVQPHLKTCAETPVYIDISYGMESAVKEALGNLPHKASGAIYSTVVRFE